MMVTIPPGFCFLHKPALDSLLGIGTTVVFDFVILLLLIVLAVFIIVRFENLHQVTIFFCHLQVKMLKSEDFRYFFA